ncbi:DNA-deoxyinosine glycosylase [Ornithinibacillus contaminans]|uniref:DNA-deoxyinosine glycosylase n=1 Tax=Ornithinibacillus contaminans TaxID=694055 RepID=UPI00064DF4A4|nr:DNA-deoxyinosine glycosylase [Ornithinibacillus contaminans]
MAVKIVGLPPIITTESKVLILGSMPSVLSLEQQAYYGNPRNHFWKILFALFKEEVPDDYNAKIAFIKEKNIALWDTIGACYREGSLDANIYGEEPNDIPSLLREYPKIRLIVCNGTKSYNTLKKYYKTEVLSTITVLKLPSTSPIPGRFNKTLAEKIDAWKVIVKYLEEK